MPALPNSSPKRWLLARSLPYTTASSLAPRNITTTTSIGNTTTTTTMDLSPAMIAGIVVITVLVIACVCASVILHRRKVRRRKALRDKVHMEIANMERSSEDSVGGVLADKGDPPAYDVVVDLDLRALSAELTRGGLPAQVEVQLERGEGGAIRGVGRAKK
ncbi:hypothetical protein BP5796_00212 [Coleophoma crateriformis]|uniref:Uncharacterized protein n=1 Tax=Coleophoma crateriformis TaxID=565419 RepID=A0A3D8T7D0_9HELO|nr:hypothetical protein BP5796_00212 [Coleophoma crateriformis]